MVCMICFRQLIAADFERDKGLGRLRRKTVPMSGAKEDISSNNDTFIQTLETTNINSFFMTSMRRLF